MLPADALEPAVRLRLAPLFCRSTPGVPAEVARRSLSGRLLGGQTARMGHPSSELDGIREGRTVSLGGGVSKEPLCRVRRLSEPGDPCCRARSDQREGDRRSGSGEVALDGREEPAARVFRVTCDEEGGSCCPDAADGA